MQTELDFPLALAGAACQPGWNEWISPNMKWVVVKRTVMVIKYALQIGEDLRELRIYVWLANIWTESWIVFPNSPISKLSLFVDCMSGQPEKSILFILIYRQTACPHLIPNSEVIWHILFLKTKVFLSQNDSFVVYVTFEWVAKPLLQDFSLK